jgi:dTDP-4-amino-4,6-dideoxygalactose transaminase
LKSFGPGALLFGDEERKELADVLESGFMYRYGEDDDPEFKGKVYRFEQELAAYSGSPYCVAMNSGTSALFAALSAAGIGPGDEVIVPGYTFIASLSSILYSRAIPVLAEIDHSLTLDPADIEQKISGRTKAIIPVHMLGNPCAMDRILALAQKYNLLVIEDACQAFGGSYKGKKLGSLGQIGCYSFNRFKTINSGDGGALVTADRNYYERAFAFHDQGHLPYRKGIEMGNRAIIGLNFRMNELSAAVLLAQLRRTDYIVDKLKKNKKLIKDILSEVDGLKFRRINDPDGEAGTLLTLQFDDPAAAEGFADELGAKPVFYSGWHVYTHMEQLLGRKMPAPVNCPFTCPVHGLDVKYKAGMLPQTEDILKRSVTIGIGVIDRGNGAGFGVNILSGEEEIIRTAEKLAGILKKYL